MRIGIDTGGTFTDTIFLDATGVRLAKVPSTPSDPSLAAIAALPSDLPSNTSVVHGTTVATNALLTRSGAKTALITTQGCADVLEIARQTRPKLYDLCPSRPAPLIPAELRFEVTERLDWQGMAITPLDLDSVQRALDRVVESGAETLAVCLLFSFLDAGHEQLVGQLARERGLRVSLSSEVAPESREYERTATTCANACVAPVMERYLGQLQYRMNERGVRSLRIMQSSGGAMSAEEAARFPVRTAVSGPAGGAIAAAGLAKRLGIASSLSFDMGGTSTDVCHILGEPGTVRTAEIAGIPLLTPMIDIHTVGAGGGSTARLDSAGGLRVGPESAGADPGPVAYGKGDQLTVTDANILLGRLPAEVRLAGQLPLDAERVRNRFEILARQMNCSSEQAAEGVLKVVNAQMARALRHVSLERGHDPAGDTLIAFGGAGGLHACALAEALGMSRVIIPPCTGAFSALGLALADVRRDYARSLFLQVASDSSRSIHKPFQEMEQRAKREMDEEGVRKRVLKRFVEMRYVGQSYTLPVPVKDDLNTAAQRFHRMHRKRYGHADPTSPVEVVAIGLSAIGQVKGGMEIADLDLRSTGADVASVIPKKANVWLNAKWVSVPVMHREVLVVHREHPGPAIITQNDATTFVEPGWSCRLGSAGELDIRRIG